MGVPPMWSRPRVPIAQTSDAAACPFQCVEGNDQHCCRPGKALSPTVRPCCARWHVAGERSGIAYSFLGVAESPLGGSPQMSKSSDTSSLPAPRKQRRSRWALVAFPLMLTGVLFSSTACGSCPGNLIDVPGPVEAPYYGHQCVLPVTG